MALQISGRNVNIGNALREQAENRIGDALHKYFDGGFTGHLTVEREGSGFKTDCTVHLDTGIVLQAHGQSQDVHQSFDIAADRIEKRLRRYKRRLKEHHKKAPAEAATRYVIAAPDDEEEVAADYSPAIIAEETTNLETMTVSGAVMSMDLTESPVLIFRNAAHGGVNVVYRRPDGHIGWVDPSLQTSRTSTNS
ncbi:ribosome hibernation-promoting factor, HPF/YfiA family [Bauldia sp.]|uniref:ribosome hibernation-promoting factor, HPF/YfiA family n=1 Tax=Bauldia sp. TaxID=2575872 RepID=UPI003BAD3C12